MTELEHALPIWTTCEQLVTYDVSQLRAEPDIAKLDDSLSKAVLRSSDTMFIWESGELGKIKVTVKVLYSR